MAHTAIRSLENLEQGYVLAPERYDPRTNPGILNSEKRDGITIGQLANLVREIVMPQKGIPDMNYLVLDTGDANHGFITVASKERVDKSGIGSAKKSLRFGDVIISRLRPYLRQVAWVDHHLSELFGVDNLNIIASTEFYVLRSASENSLAFLVPFLLSSDVQDILSASQEGGHHPRFHERTLLNLIVPGRILAQRDQLSSKVELAVNAARRSELDLKQAIAAVGYLLRNEEDISKDRRR